jgi:hypothetical protein
MAETEVNTYATEAQFREHMADSGSKLVADQCVRALNAASRAIDKFCGRRFWQDPTVVARRYRPRDGSWVVVDDISTTTGLVIATGTAGTFDTILTAADYELGPLNAAADGKPWWSITALGAAFPVSAVRATLQVTARFGPPVKPDEVEMACLLKAAKLFGRKDSRDGVRGFSEFGPVRISRFEDPDVVDLLEDFVRISMPDE